MSRRKSTKPARTAIEDVDDDDAIEAAEPEAIDDDEVAEISHVVAQLAGTSGVWASVLRQRSDGELAHVAKVTDLAAFDVDEFGRTHGAGKYQMRFYQAGSRGMVHAPQRFVIDDGFGRGTLSGGAAGEASPAARTAPAERSDRLFELIITQQAESSRQMQAMMIAGQTQMTQIVTALIGAKGSTASELAALVQVTRDLAPDDGIVESAIKAAPEVLKTLNQAEANAAGPTLTKFDQLAIRQARARRLALLAAKARENRRLAPPGRHSKGSGGAQHPPTSRPRTTQLNGSPSSLPSSPASPPPTATGIPAELVQAVAGCLREQVGGERPMPLRAAVALIDTFGPEPVEGVCAAVPAGELAALVVAHAPDLPVEFVEQVEDALRSQLGEEEEEDDADDGVLATIGPDADAVDQSEDAVEPNNAV